MAAGGFVSRAFESMLKECAGKKHPALQNSIQTFLDSTKDATNRKNIESVNSSSSSVNEIQGIEDVGENVATALAIAGKTLEGAEVELVLNPLRLAMETKNLRILESALDCLHKLIEYDHLEGDPGLESGKNASLFTNILNMICNSIDNFSPDSTVLLVLKVLLTAVASSNFRVHGEPLLGVIRSCCNIALNSKSPVNQATSKAMLTHMISVIFRKMEKYNVSTFCNDATTNVDVSDGDTVDDAIDQSSFASLEELMTLGARSDLKGLEGLLDKVVQCENGKKITRGIDLEGMNVEQRDGLLVFRTLCNMTMKEDNDELTIKTRILSFELLQGLLEGVSLLLTKNFYFIDSIKANLSYALLRASMSKSPVLFQHATGIFSLLLLRFRESLKGEIGMFFPLIVFRSLDGSDCPVHQKTYVLRMLEKVCKDFEMLVDIYLNYDCDGQAPNLFERLVTILSKITQGSQFLDSSSAATSQSTSIKISSIQCLVSILKSLVGWEKYCKESRKKIFHSDSLIKEDFVNECDVIEGRIDHSSYIENAEEQKSSLKDAISEFNRDSNKGIIYLLSSKLVEKNPSSVAQFLLNNENFDKVMIGEYLGQQDEFPHSVMHAFIDSIKFTGMKFDIAIRELFKRVWLPAQAPKIDQIMEKFAERYCADNPAVFKNPDIAYVLAVCAIMLNIDAHNSMVYPKISKLDFIRMNEIRGSDDCAPIDLLEEIYDSIVNEENKIWDDVERDRLLSALNLSFCKRKSETGVNYKDESIFKETQKILKKQKREVFYNLQQLEILRSMVEAVGWPLLATLSVTLEEGDDKSKIALCMEGFDAGIHITYSLGMDTMRYAFLTSLVRFTFLHAPRNMRGKNADALRTLLALCDSDPNSLTDTWNAVLECVSRLDFITSNPSMSAIVMLGSNQITKDAVLSSLRELAGKPSELVFVNCSKLPSDSVVEFFTALCAVSAEELKQIPARVFSLQKLVEISYYNMARIRMVWARIWSVLSSHFIFAGSHRDENVASYAVDSLKQIGMKYLDHDELQNFTFQNDILNPFAVLMRSSRSESIRRLVVDCIVQIIKAKVKCIKSGWRCIFMIFSDAADDDEAIAECAFENVEQVVLEHFEQVASKCFMDCVNCLIRFANHKSSQRISLKAIALLRICENKLSEDLLPGGVLKPMDSNEICDVAESYWFPMLAGLSELTSDSRPEVQSCAIDVLFDLLNERGQRFSPSFWENIFHRVLFPIFDTVRDGGQENFISSNDQWFRESNIHSLRLLCNLFNTFYKEVCAMLPPLLSLLLDCAKKPDQTVVSIAMGALAHLIEVGGHQFTESDWDTLLKSISDAAYATQPLELLNSPCLESPRTPETGTNVDVGFTVPDYPDDNANLDGSEGLPSPSRTSPKGVERNQTIGRKFMDTLFLRSFTAKRKSLPSDNSSPSSPVHKALQHADDVQVEGRVDVIISMSTIRGKCLTQLLLLEAIKAIQNKFWENLNDKQKTDIMDVLLSTLEFASSFNSYTNLRSRMHSVSPDRPPSNLLRQELEGTSIYLDVLLRTTATLDDINEKSVSSIERIAEEKLVFFCGQVLGEASDLQSTMEKATNMDIHYVLELRSPVIVKVLKSMCFMNTHIFKRRIKEFYPVLTKLIRCNQIGIRGALSDLFKAQLKALLP